MPFSEKVVSSDSLLASDSLPSSLAIVGGGYIGCEFASILNEFGTKVTIAEMMNRLLPLQDDEVSTLLQKTMQLGGIKVNTGSKVEIKTNEMFVSGQRADVDKILVAIGRKPAFNSSELDALGIKHSIKGIETSPRMETNHKGVYVVGDVVGKSMLAHSSYEEAFVAASNIMGHKAEMDYSCIPECIFTFPEIASVGTREGDVGKSSFISNSKAVILGEKHGFVKIWAKDGVIQGGTIIGPHATDLISEIALAVKNKLSISALADTIHPHPTLSEAIQEAARDLLGRQLHGMKKNM